MASAERVGVPAAGIFCSGFTTSGRLVAEAEGLSALRLVEYPPPNIQTQGPEAVYEYARALLDKVVKALTKPVTPAKQVMRKAAEAEPREILFRGSLEEVNEFFYERRWTDGLPIMPPTLAAVEEMLKYTDRSPEEVVGVLRPERRKATVWNIAVNGVMAGCRPEYMPVLLAVIEAIEDPRFGLEHAGATQASTPVIVLNGPIRKELDFNTGQGVMRPGRQANVSVSRFLRLQMVNVAGYLLGSTDMATFGRNYTPVLAENEEESPWKPLSVEQGFEPGSNVVTVFLMHAMSDHYELVGDASVVLKGLAIEVARELKSTVTPLTRFGPEVSPLIAVSPLVASIIAKAGYSKGDVKQHLFEKARVPAHLFDEDLGRDVQGLTACGAVKLGLLPKFFCESEDSNRLLPVVHNPEEFMIVVAGHALRNRSFIMPQAGCEGLATSKEIKLPANWEQLLTKTKKR